MKKKLSLIVAVFLVLAMVLPATALGVAPSAPSGLLANVVNAGQVDLAWTDNSLDEASFRVERATNNTFTLNLRQFPVAANTPNFSDTTATAVTTFFYRVFAVNADGDSDPSGFVSVTTPQSVPQVTLVHPAPPTANFGSGAPNVIDVTAASPGSTITSVDYQAIFADPPGTFTALEVFAQAPIAVPAIPGARNTGPSFVGQVPASSAVLFVVFGQVTATRAVGATGATEWAIGSPPMFVYQTADTTMGDGVAVGAEVKVVASRTLAPGPVVAEVIRTKPGGGLANPPPPTFENAFLFNGTLESITPGVTGAGFSLGGTVWNVRDAGGILVPFRVDDPGLPAAIDPGIGLGIGENPVITVEFAIPIPTNVVENIALEIFGQVIPTFATRDPNPVSHPALSPLQIPPGSWRLFVIFGTVTAIDAVNGEWQIGSPPVFVYEAADGSTGISDPPPVVGDGVKIVANRTLAPGPILAEVIRVLDPGPQPVTPPGLETAFLFNGVVEAQSPPISWTVGGVPFNIADAAIEQIPVDPLDPLGPQRDIVVGDAITVEFAFAGPPPPNPDLWTPLVLNAASGLRGGVLAPPAIPAARGGTLFLRATNTQGQVTITETSATLLAVPAAPPVAPTGAAAVLGGETQVNVSWNDTSADEASFRVERATDAAFTLNKTTILAAANTTTFIDTTAPTGTELFYRVFAVNGAGDSAASNTATVTIPLFVPPTQPRLARPANQATTTNLTPLLEWNPSASSLAVTYQLEVVSSTGGVVVQAAGLAVTSFQVPAGSLSAAATFRWRVRAVNAAGFSPWSAFSTFRTPAGPTPPRPESPPRGRPVNDLTPALAWSAVTGTVSYDVQVARSATFAAIVAQGVGLAANSFAVPPGALQGSTLYFWRVRVTTNLGTSRWSAASSFRTPSGPRVAPLLLAVVPNGVTPTLRWRERLPGATSYDLQIATSRTFAAPVLDQAGIASTPPITSFVVPGATLAPGTRYFWRVRGVNAFGASRWQVGSFVTPP